MLIKRIEIGNKKYLKVFHTDQFILEYGGNRPWIHCSFNRTGNRTNVASNKFGTRVSPGNYIWRSIKYMT